MKLGQRRVGEGDLDARVPVPETRDDLAMLGEVFNGMTAELRVQRDALIEKNRETEAQRLLFDSVLTSVSAGVVGLDAQGRIGFANPSALRLLALEEAAALGRPIDALVPEFSALFGRLRGGIAPSVQDEVRLSRRGKAESLLVRMGRRAAAARARGAALPAAHSALHCAALCAASHGDHGDALRASGDR